MAVGILCSWHIQQSQTGPQEKGLARKHHANKTSQRGGLLLLCDTQQGWLLNKKKLSYSFSDGQVTNFPYETKKSTRPEPWLSKCINISLLHRGFFSKKQKYRKCKIKGGARRTFLVHFTICSTKPQLEDFLLLHERMFHSWLYPRAIIFILSTQWLAMITVLKSW